MTERIRDKIVDEAYGNVVKPLIYRHSDPESSHNEALQLLRWIGKMPPLYRRLVEQLFSFQDERLNVTLWGTKVRNPFGVAAGFCKDGDPNVIKAMKVFGAGFIVVGSVPQYAREGNERPRLFRLEKERGAINRMNLNSPGAEAVVDNLRQLPPPGRREMLVGVSVIGSIGDDKDALGDPIEVLNMVYPFVDFLELNVSCPNHSGLRKNYEEGYLRFVDRVVRWRNTLNTASPPILPKFSPDHEEDVLLSMVRISKEAGFEGIVLSNATEKHFMLPSDTPFINEKGALSGAPLKPLSLKAVSLVSGEFPGFPIVGVGGIENYEDVIDYKKAGAELCQVLTGMIFVGPNIFRKLNQEAVKR